MLAYATAYAVAAEFAAFAINRYAPTPHFEKNYNILYGAFPPRGAGREGAVLLGSVTCRVSTADGTLMVGGV